MSYRSLKRVLGETHLEIKLLFLFAVCLILAIGAAFIWYDWQTVDLVYQQNRNKGELFVAQEMLTKHWKVMETRDPATGRAGPQEKYGAVIDALSRTLTKQEYSIEYIRPHVTEGKGRPRDEFEKGVHDEFVNAKLDPLDKGDVPESAERTLPGPDEYQYFQAIRAPADEKTAYNLCLNCHGLPGGGDYDTAGMQSVAGERYSASVPPPGPGDVIRIAKVTIPNGPTRQKLWQNRVVLWTTVGVAVFLAVVASYLIVRYVIVKPLRHLRDVSDAISRGNLSLRAEIQTGDEFEELAVAFNRMLRHLITIQEELRQVNVNLDVKVDELAQANMRLYEMNTIKSDFLATMSHELRTPLNSILGFSEVLGSIDSLNDKQKRYVQNIQSSGRTLLEMINDILDLAKMESGKMEVRLTDFPIGAVVSAQCDMARPLTEKKNIDLETDIPPGLPPMCQDQARVQQALNNLLSNAIKFTPEGGRITVRIRHDDEDCLVLQVIDTGVGIAEEDQQVIFEKFRQGHGGVPTGDAMTREYSGTGLGLSIVKELCKLLGGDVSVASELGKGSTFTVRLPWSLPDPQRSDAPRIEGFDEFTKTRFEFPREHERQISD